MWKNQWDLAFGIISVTFSFFFAFIIIITLTILVIRYRDVKNLVKIVKLLKIKSKDLIPTDRVLLRKFR